MQAVGGKIFYRHHALRHRIDVCQLLHLNGSRINSLLHIAIGSIGFHLCHDVAILISALYIAEDVHTAQVCAEKIHAWQIEQTCQHDHHKEHEQECLPDPILLCFHNLLPSQDKRYGYDILSLISLSTLLWLWRYP